MSLTKKDFEALAGAFKAETERNAKNKAETKTGTPAEDVVKRLAEAVADVCRGENPRFNRDRFLNACGVKG